jgi:hypothetical protein
MRATLALLLGLAACGQSEEGGAYGGPRFVSESDHFSIRALEGWEVAREAGSTVFHQPDTRATIAIRIVASRGDWTEERTTELVFPATERFLALLPGVHLGSTKERTVPAGPAVEFRLSFRPNGFGGKRYDRRHVAIVTADHVIHITATAPQGQLGQALELFDGVVDSFREEG